MAGGHWTEELFLRHSEIFLAIHEHSWPYGEEQARQVKALLDRFGMSAGGRILDVPCGIGRHGTRLAKAGYRVVGVDLVPAYVARAMELARTEGVADRATYRRGDLRGLKDVVPSDAVPFDAALNLWTSLGYYDEATDVGFLRDLRGLVRPGGLLLVESVNRDYLVRAFEPQGRERFGDLVQVESRHFDVATSRMRNEWRFFRQRGEDLDHLATIPIDHRVYAAHELRELLEAAGWKAEAFLAGLGGEPASFEAPRLLAGGRR